MQFRLRTIFLLFVVVWSSLALGSAIYSDAYAPAVPSAIVFGALLLGGFVKISKLLSSVKKVPYDWPGLFICYVGFCVLCYPIGPGCIDLREASRGSCCRNQFKQIGLALLMYETKYHCFPPAYVADKCGKPMHSWRTLILPYLGEDALYQRYRFDEPWDGPNNRKLIGKAPPQYSCPEDEHGRDSVPHTTSYVVVVGPTTAWPGTKSMKFDDVKGGASNTILVIEVAKSDIAWSEPRDLSWDDLSQRFHASFGSAIANKHRIPQGFFFEDSPGRINAILADGSSCSLSESQLSPASSKRSLAVGGYREDDSEARPSRGGGVNWRNCATLLIWTASMYLLLRRASRYRARTLAVADQAAATTMPTKVN